MNTAAKIVHSVTPSAPIELVESVPAFSDCSTPTHKALVLGTILAVFQILDGTLTMIGVSRAGEHVEGNPILRALMVEFGYIQTLVSLKVIAVVMVILLTISSSKLPWVTHALAAISAVYFVGAILPWSYLLFVR